MSVTTAEQTDVEPPDDLDERSFIDTTVEVGTRGRVYLTQSHKAELGIDGESGYGTELLVVVRHPSNEWLLGYAIVRLQSYGEFTIPVHIREQFDIETGTEIEVYAEVATRFTETKGVSAC